MSTLKTAGDLRAFLADVLVGIREGRIDHQEASAIAKVSAQINQSLTVDVNAKLQLAARGESAGDMLLGGSTASPEPMPAKVIAPPAKCTAPDPAKVVNGKVWCEQCEANVAGAAAIACKSAFCKARQ